MYKKTYKDLSAKEALILRFFEITATRIYEILGGKRNSVCNKKAALHAAWLYRKYLVSLPKSYSFLYQCYINAENGQAYTISDIQEYFLKTLMNTKIPVSVMESIAGGGCAYQGLNYSLGILEWSKEIDRLFQNETWNWKNDLTLTKVSDAEAEGREMLYIYVEFLDKPSQRPVLLRRIGPFTKYVYRYSAAFDAETLEPVDISGIEVARLRTRPANDSECSCFYD